MKGQKGVKGWWKHCTFLLNKIASRGEAYCVVSRLVDRTLTLERPKTEKLRNVFFHEIQCNFIYHSVSSAAFFLCYDVRIDKIDVYHSVSFSSDSFFLCFDVRVDKIDVNRSFALWPAAFFLGFDVRVDKIDVNRSFAFGPAAFFLRFVVWIDNIDALGISCDQ